MILKILSSKRAIRSYLKNFDNEIIPKVLPIDEFFNKVIVVEGKKFVDEELKKIYLYKAIENIDAQKLLSLGIKKNFLEFFKNSELVFGFLNEVYLERVNLDEIEIADTYEEYSEHISILKQIYFNYKKILTNDGFVDKITIDEFRINENFLKQFEKIEFELLGYLTRFDLEVLEKIEIPIEISFRVTPYNKNLISKMFGELKEGEYVLDFHTKNVLKYDSLPNPMEIQISYFTKRIDQVNFVMACIEELRDEIDPSKIAVILPDEGFSEYLKLFNNPRNINFAMGEDFSKSNIYNILNSIYLYINEEDEVAGIKIQKYLDDYENMDIFDFIEKYSNNEEKKLLDEEIYKLKKMRDFFESYEKKEILHFILNRLKNLSFPDVGGGKVTAMGVLESRGADIEAAIIVDFNDEFVPNVSDKDFFLNTPIRKKVNLPTREDKEALQKNYYYNIFLNAKKVKISYVKNEENTISKFAYDLGLGDGENMEDYYSEVLYKFNNFSKISYNETFEKPKVLWPSSLDTLLECPRKYYFRYVLEISNEIEEEDNFGNKFHRAMNDASKLRFKNDSEYFDFIMNYLLKDADIKEKFFIKTQWENKLRDFAKKDFEILNTDIKSEIIGEKIKGNFLLRARADRITKDMVIDFKTSKNSQNYDLSTQAEFYKYIFDKKVIFWDIYNVKLIEANPDLKNLDEKINKINNFSVKAEDKKACFYCEFAYLCENIIN
ncbi:PD-(D/E)XK nuclease family protein [Caminibacter sp.]